MIGSCGRIDGLLGLVDLSFPGAMQRLRLGRRASPEQTTQQHPAQRQGQQQANELPGIRAWLRTQDQDLEVWLRQRWASS